MLNLKIAFITALLLLPAACTSSATTRPARQSATHSTAGTQSLSPSTSATTPTRSTRPAPTLTAPSPSPGSPAVARYGRSKVAAALQLAAHLAYYGVADPTLLGVQSTHANIADYSDITRYLTPQASGYLRTYIADQTTNPTHNRQAASLALANLTSLPGHGTALVNGRHGLRLDKPFRVARYTATVNPRVTLVSDHVTMQVTGTCSVSINAHRGSVPVYVTFRRTSFTYFIQPTPSMAYPAAVSGWTAVDDAAVTSR